jgi:hypothetical protein
VDISGISDSHSRDKATDSVVQAIATVSVPLLVRMTITASPAILIPAYLCSLASPPHYAMPKRQDWRVDKHAVRSAFCSHVHVHMYCFTCSCETKQEEVSRHVVELFVSRLRCTSARHPWIG